mmetsp:Transcript_54180/g.144449  ORF Transcript_54180/g.144449 Transcript_54180/m.144449 type:complete len:212 (-) Transcript_54180:365-1000(-)
MAHQIHQPPVHCLPRRVCLQQGHNPGLLCPLLELHEPLFRTVLRHAEAGLEEGRRGLLRAGGAVRDLAGEGVVVGDALELGLELPNIHTTPSLQLVPRGNQLPQPHRRLKLLELPQLLRAQRLLELVGLGIEIHPVGPVRALECGLLLLAREYLQHQLVLVVHDHTVDDFKDTSHHVADGGGVVAGVGFVVIGGIGLLVVAGHGCLCQHGS